MQNVIVATRNANKVREMQEIIGEAYRVLPMDAVAPSLEIEEDGCSFEENAAIKAQALWDALEEKTLVLADDSGLEIDYLGGAPGIFSARWLGEKTPYSIKNAHVLKELEGVPEYRRGCRYVCVIAAVTAEGRRLSVRRTMEGRVADRISGDNGFGFDPIFFVPECGCTAAEMSEEDKNAISHRGKALRAMAEKLRAAGIL